MGQKSIEYLLFTAMGPPFGPPGPGGPPMEAFMGPGGPRFPMPGPGPPGGLLGTAPPGFNPMMGPGPPNGPPPRFGKLH